MARERERVFSLSKFSTQTDTDEIDEKAKESAKFSNIFSRIYGETTVQTNASGKRITAKTDDSGDEYIEPERTSYPQQVGIVGFNQVSRAKPKKGDTDIELEFS